MASLALDTLRVSKRLREAGFSEPQADAVTGIISEARETSLAELVTKSDLRETKAELKADIAELRSEVKLEIGGVKGDGLLVKWMAGVNTAMMIAILLKLYVA
jgi:hypothetical protein